MAVARQIGFSSAYLQPSVIFVAMCALALGGATSAGFLGDAILQVLSIFLFAHVLWVLFHAPGGLKRSEIALMAAILAMPLVQLVPLPPSIWAHLGSSDMRLEAYRIAGVAPDWRPASVIPEATILATLGLIPPFAIFLGVRSLDYAGRRNVVICLLLFSAMSVFLGLAQVAGGEQSPLRFFEVTNTTEAVGFFANRNHFAALLYVALMFAAAFAVDSGVGFLDARRRRAQEPRALVIFTASVTLMFLLAVAQIMARSRAGVGLTIIGSLAIAALALADQRNRWRSASVKLLGLAIVAVMLFSAQFGYSRFVARLGMEEIQNGRLMIARHTLEAARAFLPLGSGIGTFKEVYALGEAPSELVVYTYVNHAHDDFAELIMEGGVFGVALLVCFLIWLVSRGLYIWRRRQAHGAPIDLLVQRASLFSIILLMIHSFVDYPLRTSAIMAVTAICCALLTKPASPPTRSQAAAPRGKFSSFPAHSPSPSRGPIIDSR